MRKQVSHHWPLPGSRYSVFDADFEGRFTCRYCNGRYDITTHCNNAIGDPYSKSPRPICSGCFEIIEDLSAAPPWLIDKLARRAKATRRKRKKELLP